MEKKLTTHLKDWTAEMLEKSILFETPPLSVSSLSSIMDDTEDQNLDETVEMIKQDDVATKRILGRANSAISGAMEPITDLKTAIMRVGVGPMAQITVISKFQEFLTRELRYYSISGNEFWKHSIATAIATESIGRHLEQSLPNECFVAGLLHDIGKFAVDNYAQSFSIEIPDASEQSEPKPHHEVEMEQFQCEHAELGAMIASNWNMPAPLVEAIKYHHDSANDWPLSAKIVNFADHIAKSIDKNGGSESIDEERISVQSMLGIKEEEFESIRIRTRNKTSELLNTK
jgi:putative nucleotidyltransferase with HDIG domain